MRFGLFKKKKQKQITADPEDVSVYHGMGLPQRTQKQKVGPIDREGPRVLQSSDTLESARGHSDQWVLVGLGGSTYGQISSQELIQSQHVGPDRFRDDQRLFDQWKRPRMKKAVCIGINYTGSGVQLDGCADDAKSIREFLINKWGFEPENIRVLTEDSESPTKANILAAMKWLLEGAEAQDLLFFHYSGHGGHMHHRHRSLEVIYPRDHEQNGIITENNMKDLLVDPIPEGCRLIALFDSCHSGSVLGLAYLYHSDGRLESHRTTVPPDGKPERDGMTNPSRGEVICFSGREHSQKGAGGFAVGKMSRAFIKYGGQDRSCGQLLRRVRYHLERCNQRPRLSSSRLIDMRLDY